AANAFLPGGGKGFRDTGALMNRDLRRPHPLSQGRTLGLLAQVRDRGHVHSRGSEVERRAVAVGVRGEHDGAAEWLEAEAGDQPLSAGGQHDAGKVVVPEDRWLLEGAAGENDALRAHLAQARLVDERDP